MQTHKLFEDTYKPEVLKKLYNDYVSKSSAAGRDGILRGIFEDHLDNELNIIERKVKNREYQFTGYKEKLISKGSKKSPRQISIPTFRDRVTLRATHQILRDIFPEARPLPPHKFIKNILEVLPTLGTNYSFLRMDVENFYPSIDHMKLMKKIRAKSRTAGYNELLLKALQTPTGVKNTHHNRNVKGVPQGLSISNILSSIYLQNVDKKISKTVHYFRYVDDILVICPTALTGKYFRDISHELSKLNLTAHPPTVENSAKSGSWTTSEGTDYLGFRITNNSISVRDSSFKRMFRNLLNVFTSYKYHQNLERFEFRINLKISGCIFEGKRRGWMFFFSQTRDMHQLKELDAFIKKMQTRFGLNGEAVKLKTFTKAYHEIRYNFKESTYFSNFDLFTLEEKVLAIHKMTGKSLIEIETWNPITIEEIFTKSVVKAVNELESDVLEAFS